MKKIRWERVKQNAIDVINGMDYKSAFSCGGLFNNPIFKNLPYVALMEGATTRRKWEDVTDEARADIVEMLRRWDVRRVSELVKIFSENGEKIGPKKILSIEYDEKGEWVLWYK